LPRKLLNCLPQARGDFAAAGRAVRRFHSAASYSTHAPVKRIAGKGERE
jgi:hypothetical protein